MERSVSAHLSEKGRRPLLSGLLLSLGISLFFSFLFLFLLAFLLYKADDPLRLLTPALYITPMLCGFLCGFSFAKRYRSGGALLGLFSGAILSLLLFGIGLILQGGRLPLSSLFLYLPIPLLSLLGARLSQRRQSKRKRKRR